jgi:hypothetical protein
MAFYYRAENGTANIHIGGYNVKQATFTLEEDTTMRLYVYLNAGISVADITDAQLELGSTATAYEPYQGESITIPFGDTVYGGTLDVTEGKLTVDRAMYTFDGSNDEGWTKSDQYAYFTTSKITGAINVNASAYNFLSNKYGYGNISNGSSTLGACLIWAALRVRLADMSISLGSFKESLSEVPMTALLKLATPITIDLTDIPELTTLLGQNNIWSDSGDVDVTYRADTGLYIDKLTGSTEEDMIADTAIASGKYFLVGNTLYLSTAAIAAGATLTPGTNCVQTTLAEALNNLNS